MNSKPELKSLSDVRQYYIERLKDLVKDLQVTKRGGMYSFKGTTNEGRMFCAVERAMSVESFPNVPGMEIRSILRRIRVNE